MKKGTVDMTHGSGGRAMAQLVEDLFVRHFDNDLLRQANDQAAFGVTAGRMVMSTDGHVISPLFFPGADIGALSVHGTINDVAMSGASARPLYLSAGFILEEGFPLADLERIVASMAQAALTAGVPVVTGDTKVVEKGKGDGVFITTTGIGSVPEGVNISGDLARPGDAILINGTIGDHGVAIMSSRENLEFETSIESDSAALHTLVADMVAAVPDIHYLRDPTRGGLATTLNELARQSAVGMRLQEDAIPVNPAVNDACELLGLDPLYVANEGKLVCICPADRAQQLLAVMRSHPLGADSAIIGRCQPWRAKRRLVDPSSRETALFSRRALRQRENKVGLRTRRPVIWEPSTEQQRACEVVAQCLVTRTAGAQIGCQRPSRFWGLGCPKIYHEAEDTLAVLHASIPSRSRTRPRLFASMPRISRPSGRWAGSGSGRWAVPWPGSPAQSPPPSSLLPVRRPGVACGPSSRRYYTAAPGVRSWLSASGQIVARPQCVTAIFKRSPSAGAIHGVNPSFF